MTPPTRTDLILAAVRELLEAERAELDALELLTSVEIHLKFDPQRSAPMKLLFRRETERRVKVR